MRRAVGLDRLRIVPADIATGQKTSISAGKYIGRKLFVEVITDGQGYSATRVEYQMTRWLSLLSSVSTIGRTSANVACQQGLLTLGVTPAKAGSKRHRDSGFRWNEGGLA